MTLTNAQIRHLKSLAHHLKPLSYVGKQGITEAFVKSVGQTLFDHELVKVKFNEYQDEKDGLSEELARQCGANIVAMVGNTVILFKQQSDEDRRKVKLPR